MSRFSKNVIATLLAALLYLLPAIVFSQVYWEPSGSIQLEGTPLDIVQAQETRLTFILTDQAKVLVYSPGGILLDSIRVAPSVTGIAVSSRGEQLSLIDANRKTLENISVLYKVRFNTDGSPFLGPSNAKVTVAVFSDFQ